MKKYYCLLASVLFSILVLRIPTGFCADQTISGLFSQPTQKTYLVERVLSADKILLETGEKIRLIGLNAPQPPRPEKTEYDEQGVIIPKVEVTQTLEERAFGFVQKLLQGQEVRLELDSQKKDKNFLTFAYVYLVKDNTFVNAEVLRQGYAQLQLVPPNLKYQDILRAAYQEARKERRGLQEDY